MEQLIYTTPRLWAPKVVRKGKKQNMNGERWLLQLGHGPGGSLCYSLDLRIFNKN